MFRSSRNFRFLFQLKREGGWVCSMWCARPGGMAPGGAGSPLALREHHGPFGMGLDLTSTRGQRSKPGERAHRHDDVSGLAEIDYSSREEPNTLTILGHRKDRRIGYVCYFDAAVFVQLRAKRANCHDLVT